MTTPDTLPEIDAKLGWLRAQVTTLGTGLYQLDEDPGHKLLEEAALAGRTAREWAVAKDQLAQAWQQYGLLADKLGQLEALRGTKARVRVETLLALGAALNADLGGAGSGAPTRAPGPVTVPDAVAAATASYTAATEFVAAVDCVGNDFVPRIGALHDRLAQTEADARSGRFRCDVLVQAREQLDRLRATALVDPLAVAVADLAAVEALAGTAAAEVAKAAAVRAGLADALSLARREARDIAAEIDAAECVQRESTSKIAGALDTGALVQARQRLAHLDATLGNDDPNWPHRDGLYWPQRPRSVSLRSWLRSQSARRPSACRIWRDGG